MNLKDKLYELELEKGELPKAYSKALEEANLEDALEIEARSKIINTELAIAEIQVVKAEIKNLEANQEQHKEKLQIARSYVRPLADIDSLVKPSVLRNSEFQQSLVDEQIALNSIKSTSLGIYSAQQKLSELLKTKGLP